jgi:DNA-binding transcriptional MerR regulator
MDATSIEAFKNAGFTFEEIQEIIEAEKDIENGETYDFDEVMESLQKELFSNAMKPEYV